MPGLDGYETTRRLRSLEAERLKASRIDAGESGTRRSHIFALTANAFQEDIEMSLQAGCDAHLDQTDYETEFTQKPELNRRRLAIVRPIEIEIEIEIERWHRIPRDLLLADPRKDRCDLHHVPATVTITGIAGTEGL